MLLWSMLLWMKKKKLWYKLHFVEYKAEIMQHVLKCHEFPTCISVKKTSIGGFNVKKKYFLLVSSSDCLWKEEYNYLVDIYGKN
jgi:hypothetical protein